MEKPDYMDHLKEKALVYVGLEVNKLWNVLSQKCSQELKDNPDKFSKIYLPHGFIMPGGRFREIYYWDTYWIIRGLLISKMHKTVKGMLENFCHQISAYGHIPNGTRKYYISRSQQPYLVSMVSKYYECTGDHECLKKMLPFLYSELEFFERNRAVEYKLKGKTFTVFHFSADCRGPRPESYIEDVEIAEELFKTEEDKEKFYLHMKAAAESGWDFSSRWFINKDGENTGTLADAKTCYIVPVDLNALMYKNYVHMAEFCALLGDAEGEKVHTAKATHILKTVAELLWDPEENMWFDWDMLNHKRRKYFYASNLSPLWAEAYPSTLRDSIAKCAISYLLRTGALSHAGGIPASFHHTGQQWDWNVWPPLQHMIVSGLNKTRHPIALKVAFSIAKKYTLATIASCNSKRDGHCELFEKYDPTHPGLAGGGGEYEVQQGFGWTNGVLIDFITIYGDDLITLDEYVPKQCVGVYGLKMKQQFGPFTASTNLKPNELAST